MAVSIASAPGCDDRSPAPADGGSAGDLLLLAAASTTDAVTEIAASFERETGIAVKVSAAGSNALAAQIIAGAPGHVFLSANPRWAKAVAEEGLALDTRDLLSNRLVLVVPVGNPARIAAPRDLLSKEVSHVALAGENVPAGIYAGEALRAAGIYEKLIEEGRVARGQDVRLTLAYVETAEAQAGVVYATDAAVSGKAEVVHTFDPASHEPIVYPIVLLETARESPEARRFYEYLQGGEAAAVFRKFGFSPAE